MTYQWSQTSGPTATLATPSSPVTTVTAPAGPATLTLTLVVTDSAGRKGSDAVNVTVGSPGALVPVTITAASASKVYGQTVPAVGYTATGAIANVPVTPPVCSTTATAASGPGTYATTCTGPATDATYRYTYVSGVLTVAKAATAVTLVSSASTVGLGDPVTLTATVTALPPATGTPGSWITFYDGALQLGTAFPSAGKATLTVPNLAGGSHAFTGVYSSGANFAASTSASTAVRVTRRSVTIRAADARITLGGSAPPIAWTAQGQLGRLRDHTSGVLVGAPAGPGSYPTTCSGVSSDGNYDYVYVSGVLTVDRARVVITARNATSVLGQALPPVGFDPTGTVASYPVSVPSCSVVGPPVMLVGSYPTRCTGPASDANYDYTYVDGVLSVGRAAATVRASSPTMTFGQAVPAIGFTVQGGIAGFAPAVPVCGADPVVGAGRWRRAARVPPPTGTTCTPT